MRPLLYFLGVATGFVLSTYVALAWTGPTGSPPSNNVAAPINVGASSQTKYGFLQVNNSAYNSNSFSVVGNLSLTGVGNYLNFGNSWGSSGYGIWDNNGILEFKNSGGSWSTLQSTIYNYVGGGSQWVTGDGGSIYYNNGNVGIGTASPSYPLTVVGDVSVSGDIYVQGVCFRPRQLVRCYYPGDHMTWVDNQGECTGAGYNVEGVIEILAQC